jgi:hypothetical protein
VNKENRNKKKLFFPIAMFFFSFSQLWSQAALGGSRNENKEVQLQLDGIYSECIIDMSLVERAAFKSGDIVQLRSNGQVVRLGRTVVFDAVTATGSTVYLLNVDEMKEASEAARQEFMKTSESKKMPQTAREPSGQQVKSRE